MGSLSLWHWLIVLVIVVLVFGTKRLKNVGQDLGEAVKGFKKGINDHDAKPEQLADPGRREEMRREELRKEEIRRDEALREDLEAGVKPRNDDRTPPAGR